MLSQPPGTVVQYSCAEDYSGSHECATRGWIARRIAALLGYAYGEEYQPGHSYPGRVYFIPSTTLVAPESKRLGILCERDLFGGVVPFPFLCTKSIAHPLIEGGTAPIGWSQAVGRYVGDAVLRGYTAFNRADARRAGAKLLAGGPVRVKPGEGIGGRGQQVARDAAELDSALDGVDERSVERAGVVIEQNLEEVITYSVGRIRVGDITASYVGTQGLTPDNDGEKVYGGSDLIVVPGGYDALLGLALRPEFRMAVQRARAFDAAVCRAFPAFFASRRNYDIAYGRDSGGRHRMGLLEQSWRIGGATAAEMTALEAFQADTGLRAVRACCVERYGEAARPRPGAAVYYSGRDARVGHITKFAYASEYGNAA